MKRVGIVIIDYNTARFEPYKPQEQTDDTAKAEVLMARSAQEVRQIAESCAALDDGSVVDAVVFELGVPIGAEETQLVFALPQQCRIIARSVMEGDEASKANIEALRAAGREVLECESRREAVRLLWERLRCPHPRVAQPNATMRACA